MLAITVIMSMILVNNYVLSQFLGICPVWAVSKKLDSAVGMGVAVIFVMVLATVATWPIQQILNRFDIGYLQTVVFILVIAALVQLIEMMMKKYMPPLHKALGVYLPLITTNCAVLGVCINNIDAGYGYLLSICNASVQASASCWRWYCLPASEARLKTKMAFLCHSEEFLSH